MKKEIEMLLQEHFHKTMSACTNEELYIALQLYVKQKTAEKERIIGERKLYYISAEFLIGKLLSNNLINLGLYDDVKELLQANGKSLTEIEEIEVEPSLGNGGLGRLAACFLDSIATLGLAGDGVGLNYHLGLFAQVFKDHKQCEERNDWIGSYNWLRRTEVGFDVTLGHKTVHSTMYDIDVMGYHNGVNTLHLFDLDTVEESIVHDGIQFDQNDIEKNLTLFLYPDDSTHQGQLLRIYQQYFMVSNAAQLILKEERHKGHDLRKLHEYVCIQINDTHPSLVIPELISLLMKEGLHLKEAAAIVSKTCAYTNHTILAEALEKWPFDDLKQVVPHLIPIIEALDAMVDARFPQKALSIIDDANRVHMAHMDIHYGFSVNGVAALHTDILKHTELKPFYDCYPDKFNNKTNGITFRRWLLHCNPRLRSYLDELIGEDYKKDATCLEKLLEYAEDDEVLTQLDKIKTENKKDLIVYLKQTQNIDLDENSIFDIQIKRLHEYKRQQMNALYIIHKYMEIKAGHYPSHPITCIFGAKAAPAYTIAKDILHLLLCLQELINNDSEAAPYLRVVVVENYNVTKAEKLIPACDISEQISLASKEASGTGNMKFMLNGAVTLGTKDGANVEIHDLVGDEAMVTFGASSEEVIAHYEHRDYHPKDYYENDKAIKEAVEFITSSDMITIGDKVNLTRLQKELMEKDWFMTLLDLKDYIRAKDQMIKDYTNRREWNKKSLRNIAKAGFFSSDRTIAQYNEDIWKLHK